MRLTPTWIDPAWLKAPLLLRRFPATLLSILGAAAILGTTTAAAPLLLSSAGNAAITQELDQYGSDLAGVTFSTFGFIQRRTFDPANAEVKTAGDELSSLGEPTVTVLGATTDVQHRDRETQVRFLFRTSALANVDMLTPDEGLPGAWIAESSADELGVEPGDHVVLENFRTRREVPIAGIYRDLASGPLSDYWSEMTYEIVNEIPNQPPLRPFMIMEEDQFLDSTGDMAQQATFSWTFPLVDKDLTLPQAQGIAAEIQERRLRASDPLTDLGRSMAALTLYGTLRVQTSLTTAIDNSEDTVTAIEGPVRLISLAGRLVALIVIGAAGIFSYTKRRTEAKLLSAQGRTLWWQGTKASVEVLLPALAGASGGWFLATRLISIAGPGAPVSNGVAADALQEVMWWTAAAVVVLGAVYGVGAHQETQFRSSRLRRVAARIPWELLVLALAGASLYEVLTREDPIVRATDAPATIDMLLLAFPFLFIAGISGLATRGLRRLLPRLRNHAAGAKPWRYLAIRRFAATQKIGLLVITAASVALGTLVYSGTLVATTEETVRAKAQILAGSDVSIAVQNIEDVSPGIDLEWTPVAIGTGDLLPMEQRVDVLSVDVETFAEGAFWDPRFADRPLDELLADLVSDGPRAPVILAGLDAPREATVDARGKHLPVEVVAAVHAWPGMAPNRPMMIVDGPTYTRVAQAAGATATDPFATDQVWAKGSAERALRMLEQEGVLVQYHRSARDVQASPPFRSLSWTFGFLRALGLMAGALAVIGVVLYIQSRQASRDVSYAIARRMGLRRRSHRGAIAAELAAMLATSFVIGGGLALVAAALVLDEVDPLPGLPPGSLLTIPSPLVWGTALALFLVGGFSAWFVQRRADRINVAEVMRLAG